MKLINYFTRRSSMIAACVGAAAIAILGMIAGLTANATSQHPLPLLQQRKTAVEIIDLAQARMLFDQKILFVDARSPGDFSDRHIAGAYNFDYFNFDRYFPEFLKKVKRTAFVVVYCEGISGPMNEDTCETSRLLGQRLFESGYRNVRVFEQGFAFWEKAKYPQQGGSGADGAEKHRSMPWINYLRDLVMLALGAAALLLLKKQPAIVLVQLLLGTIFIVSGSTKLFAPEKLAIIIHSYGILPQELVPFAAAGMPWIEFLAGVSLVTGILPSAGALIVTGMQLFFIPALAFRAVVLSSRMGLSVFGVDFDCGCGLGENFAWVLILRDFGFLFMGAAVIAGRVRWANAHKGFEPESRGHAPYRR